MLEFLKTFASVAVAQEMRSEAEMRDYLFLYKLYGDRWSDYRVEWSGSGPFAKASIHRSGNK